MKAGLDFLTNLINFVILTKSLKDIIGFDSFSYYLADGGIITRAIKRKQVIAPLDSAQAPI